MHLINLFNYISLEENGVMTECNLKTQDADDVLDFNFCNTGLFLIFIANF